MKKKQRKNQKRKPKINPQDYEGFSYGPIKVERYGRNMLISSNWDQGEFERHIQNVRAKRPELKEEINSKIQELLSEIRQFDPLYLLSAISLHNNFVNPEEYSETDYGLRQSYFEYAQSIVLACNSFGFDVGVDKEIIEKFETLVAEIFHYVSWYFGTEAAEATMKRVEEDLRRGLLNRYLFVRGDSFPEHHIELIKGVFREHDPFLTRHFGLTIDEITIAVECIRNQILDNVEQVSELFRKTEGLHGLLKEFVDKEGPDSFSSIDECRKKYLSLPGVQEEVEELLDLQEELNETPFIVKPTEEIPEEFLRLLSSALGDNESFASFAKTPGWPTNDSIIYKRPLIIHDGRYYCFCPRLLFTNIGRIAESWVKEKDDCYFQEVFQKKRAKYLEGKALAYTEAMLPGAQVYERLYYRITENGEEKRLETDGIVLYDNNLFIVEAKAGRLSTSARRGGLEQMKRDVAELIGNAYSQALRTRQFIRDNDRPRSEYENGKEALVLEDKNRYENVYFINVTLQSLGQLSTHLNSLKTLNLTQGKEWPWSILYSL